jgi:hypothetical protein
MKLNQRLGINYKYEDGLHVFYASGHLDKVNNGIVTDKLVWTPMQRQNVREKAISLCANEDLLLKLDYGFNRKSWSWSISFK